MGPKNVVEMKKYENVEAYVRDHGFRMKDLTPEQIAEAEEEMKDVNAGYEILDGVFSPLGAARHIITGEEGA